MTSHLFCSYEQQPRALATDYQPATVAQDKAWFYCGKHATQRVAEGEAFLRITFGGVKAANIFRSAHDGPGILVKELRASLPVIVDPAGGQRPPSAS